MRSCYGSMLTESNGAHQQEKIWVTQFTNGRKWSIEIDQKYVFNWSWRRAVPRGELTCVVTSDPFCWRPELAVNSERMRHDASQLPALLPQPQSLIWLFSLPQHGVMSSAVDPARKSWFMFAWPEGVNAFSH